MVAAVIERIAPQAEQLVISCNRNLPQYRALGYPAVQDEQHSSQGPLAGVLAALALHTLPLTLVCPVDCPLLPADLLDTLRHALLAENAEVAVPHDGERLQHQIFLMRTESGAELADFYRLGGRSVRSWLAQRQVASADFSSRAQCLADADTPAQLARLEALAKL